MDDVFTGESMGGGYFGGAGGAAVKCAAFGEEGGAGGGVDCAVLWGGEVELAFGGLAGMGREGGRYSERTTPPPPQRDVFAALTMEVVARVVMEVRIREILELRVAEGGGRGDEMSEVFVGCSVPSL